MNVSEEQQEVSDNFRVAIMGDSRSVRLGSKETEAWLGEAVVFCCCSYFLVFLVICYRALTCSALSARDKDRGGARKKNCPMHNREV
jgi:hypothetical protein